MGFLEVILVCCGISFDVLAVSVCQGAVLQKIDKLKLTRMIAIFCATQTFAIALGNVFVFLPMFRNRAESSASLYNFCSMVIMLGLGLYLIYKGHKNSEILERRSEIDFRKVWISALLTSVDSLFAGLLFSFMDANIITSVVSVVITTALAVIAGVNVGYRLGYEPKKNAYIIGGAVLFVVAVDVMIRYFIS